MKVLSLTQPYGTLVVIGGKAIETRSWNTDYRGPVLIQAAKNWPKPCKELCRYDPFFSVLLNAMRPDDYHFDNGVFTLPTGAIIGGAYIEGCKPTSVTIAHGFSHMASYRASDWVSELSENERAFGDYSSKRFGWFLRNPVRLDRPIPAKGALGLWNSTPEIDNEFRSQKPEWFDEASAFRVENYRDRSGKAGAK